ncbi:MAG: DVU0298 family protein [Pseudomonadota bacterium]
MRFRELKQQIHGLLNQDDFAAALDEIRHLPPRQVVNPLFSFFHSHNELLKWRAVTAMGHAVDRMVLENRKEEARVVMRRLIWNLNDESGGIGWGSPEAMGEIMARNRSMAEEYHRILLSYIMPHGNYLEHAILQRGLLWGLGRLAHEEPGYVESAVACLIPFLSSQDPFHRGLASWTAALYDYGPANTLLRKNRDDPSILTLYQDGVLQEVTVSSMASRKKDGF